MFYRYYPTKNGIVLLQYFHLRVKKNQNKYSSKLSKTYNQFRVGVYTLVYATYSERFKIYIVSNKNIFFLKTNISDTNSFNFEISTTLNSDKNNLTGIREIIQIKLEVGDIKHFDFNINLKIY